MVAGQMASTPLLASKSASVWMASSEASQKSLPMAPWKWISTRPGRA